MTFNKSALAASISLVTLALAGCGGGAGSQDSGSSTSSVKLSGLVVDPYVAQAKVYVDLDNDGIHQFSTEDFAYTDKDGYFSISKPDANGQTIDYCATGNTRHCLNTTQVRSGAVLRIEGGYDVATGQPFIGSMEMPLNLNGTDTKLDTVNPLISLFTAASTDQENAILDFIDPNVANDDSARATLKASLTKDFLAQDANGTDGVDPEKFRRAMQVHKAVAILSSALEHKYGLKAGGKKVNGVLPPASAGKFVYAAVAEMLATLTASTAPTDINWQTALTNADTALQPKTGKTAVSWNPNEKEAIASRVAQLFNWFDTNKDTIKNNVTTAKDSTAKQESLYQYARVADFAVGQVKREVKAGTVQNETNGSQSVMGQVLTQITGDTSTFKISNFDNKLDIGSIVSATSLPNSVPTFTEGGQLFVAAAGGNPETTMANKVLTLTYADSGSKTGTVNFYFSPSTTSTVEGTLALCVKATGDSSSLNEITGIKQGIRLAGRWSKLTDFSVTVAITEPVTPEQALIIKRTKKENPQDTYQFSLDATAGLETWKGTLKDFTSSAPKTDAECVSAFSVPN